MKKWKAFITRGCSLFLSAVLLAGCGGGSSTASTESNAGTLTTQQGGYVEEEITPDSTGIPGTALGFFYVGDALHYFTVTNFGASFAEQEYHWYTLKEDDSWSEEHDLGLADIKATLGTDWVSVIPDLFLDPDGTLYWNLNVSATGEHDSYETVYFSVRDGKATQLDSMPDGLAGMCFGGSVNKLDLCGNAVLCSTTSSTLEAVSTSGQLLNLTLPELNGGYFFASNDNGFYLMDADHKLQHYLLGSTTAETVLDGNWFHLTDPDGSNLRFNVAAPDDTLYSVVEYQNGGMPTARLFRYRWDNNLPPPPEGELTVFSLYHSEFIENAVSDMQKKAGIPVHYNWGLEEESGQAGCQITGNRGDVLTQLNAQLLAGKGPDVLILDDMPLDSMIEKGVLMDLSGLVSTEGLLENVVDSLQQENGLYVLPGRVQPLLLTGEPALVDSIAHAEDLAQKLAFGPSMACDYYIQENPEAMPLLSCNVASELFEIFYPVFAPSIWENGTLNEAAYRSFVEMLSTIYNGAGRNLAPGTWDRVSGTYYHPGAGTGGNHLNLHCLLFCDPLWNVTSIGVSHAYYAQMMQQPDDTTTKPLTTANGQSALQAMCLTGINASTKNKDAAVQFVNLLFSEETQNHRVYDGIPVRKTVLQKQWEATLASELEPITSNTDLVAEVESMDLWIPSTLLQNAAAKGVGTWLDTGNLDSAVDAAQNAVKLWLAEQ